MAPYAVVGLLGEICLETGAGLVSSVVSRSTAAKVRFRGDAVLGLARLTSRFGDTESARLGVPVLGLASLRPGFGGVCTAVPGLDLLLCMLDGRLNGSSRRGGISCSSRSGMRSDVAVCGRSMVGLCDVTSVFSLTVFLTASDSGTWWLLRSCPYARGCSLSNDVLRSA